MKVVITGNANGIGKAIFETFSNNGIECIGYDLQDGRDVTDTRVVENLLHECQSSDVFINNALPNQHLLLSKVHEMWFGKNKVIVNVSSATTYFFNETNYRDISHAYYHHKQNLDILCKELTSAVRLPCIMNVRPSAIGNGTVSNTDYAKRINPNDLAELIYHHVINREKYHVLDIVVRSAS
jgi:hypothetical protein